MTSPTNPILQQLHRLNGSSPDFPQQLEAILRSNEYEQCVPKLQGDDLMWLVDYLDKALARLESSGTAYKKCISQLKEICGSRAVLPASYLLPPGRLDVSPDPFAAGGYGDVHQATLDGSRVRVKRVRIPQQRHLPAAKKAFCSGAITWIRLKHPNIVAPTGFTLFPLQLVSDWMPNGDVSEYIESNPNVDRVALITDVSRGICYLHSRDVVHREIKGSNVLVDAAGRARIADFGLAMVTTREGFTIGPFQREYSPRWTAPEVLSEQSSGKPADIFSFAMLMIEVFTGKPPLDDLPSLEAASAIIGGKRPKRPTHPALTGRSWQLIQRCWAQDPLARPDAPEVLQTLQPSAWKRLLEAITGTIYPF